MHKLNRLLLPLLISNTLIASGFSSEKSDLLLSHSKSDIPRHSTEKISLNVDSNKNILQGALNVIRRPPFPGGSFSGVCIISPYSSDGRFRTTWSLRPLFIWNGDITKIRVLDRETGNLLWPQPSSDEDWIYVEQGQQFIAYGADVPLAQEGFYTLELHHRQSNLPESIQFETLSPLEWQQVESELESAISRQLAETDFPSSLTDMELEQQEAIIRAETFQENEFGLWMDAFREILSLEISFENIEELQLEINQKMCK